MSLGCEDVGDRVANAPLLAGAGTCHDGLPHPLRVQVEGPGERLVAEPVGALPCPAAPREQGPLGKAGPVGDVAVFEALGHDGKQLLESLGASHAGSLRKISDEIQCAPLDFAGKVSDDVVNNAPTAANFLRRTAAGADPTPEDQMLTNVAKVPTESQLRFAREVLDRAQDVGIGLDLIDNLAASIAAANDAAALDTDVHEARYRLNDFCAHCNEDIDADGTGSLRWCSRECWLADGGDS